MSRRENSPKLELKLKLSPPRTRANNQQVGSPKTSASSSWEMSPESSCVSSEPEADDTTTTTMQYQSSPEATSKSMVVVGCPQCIMYVMVSEVDPKCPRCKSTVLLDFLNEENNKKARN